MALGVPLLLLAGMVPAQASTVPGDSPAVTEPTLGVTGCTDFLGSTGECLDMGGLGTSPGPGLAPVVTGTPVSTAPDTGATLPTPVVPTDTGTVPAGGDADPMGVSATGTYDAGTLSEVSNTTSTVSLDAAGGYCHQVEVDYGLQDTLTRQMLAWFNMYTFYCWNDRIVTYHDTWFTGSTTGIGSGFGWRYNASDLTSTFHCYYNSSVWCSGNYEEGQGSFQACVGISPVDVCYSNWNPVLMMWEQQRGAWQWARG
jgi:hypothetical protein